MTNSADPDQLAASEANWSRSALFEKAGYYQGSAWLGLRSCGAQLLLCFSKKASYQRVQLLKLKAKTNSSWRWAIVITHSPSSSSVCLSIRLSIHSQSLNNISS